ncbi:MAG TPA: GFA family protein [Devosiaceae bacterium]|jgi:hypothetical protein|nr:GFA family protein [Devosiaceae bacterium]
MRVSGSCHCGAIAFAAEIDPERVRICHCTDCQKLSGTAFRVVAPCPEDQFQLLRGAPKSYIKTAESGERRMQTFCGDCGSPVYATSVGSGGRTFGIRVGTLDQRDQLAPKRQFWQRSALSWLPGLPGASNATQ